MKQQIIDNKYLLKKLIGRGYFSQVYICEHLSIQQNTSNNNQSKNDKKIKDMQYALKIYLQQQKGHTMNKQLQIINKISSLLPKILNKKIKHITIPKLYQYNNSHKYPYMILQLCGNNLQQIVSIYRKQGKVINIKSVLMIGIQLINFVQIMHKCGYLHRDLKPQNILIGKTNTNMLYIIDYGLALPYTDKSGNHIELRTDKKLTGSYKFTSLYSYQGYTFSRRDQIQVVINILIFILTGGELPWINQKVENMENNEKLKQIRKTKETVTYQNLKSILPKQIAQTIIIVLDYSRKLNYQEQPNYEYVRQLFISCMEINNIVRDYNYCWSDINLSNV